MGREPTDTVCCLSSGIGQVAKQVKVLELSERTWQIAFDECHHTIQRLRAVLNEDARWLLYVRLSCFEQSRGLA